MALGILELISGIQGNCLMLKSLISREPLKGSYAIYKIFLLNLVCADVGIIGYFLPLMVLGLMSRYPVFDRHHCRITGFIFVSCSVASLLFQTVISLNRFLRVCHLKLHRVLFSRRRTVLLCVLCWMLAVLLALMPLVSSIGCYSFDCNGHVCSLLNNEKQHFTQIVFVASGILPVLAIGYCNWAIYQHWKGTRFKSRSQYTIIQMEIKRLKEKLKSRRRNRKKCKEESIENRWR
ncbi:melatonin receptor type 1B-B-like [Pomacea canaliculata]|uniref:melatonin receptor type 1B-B-like n=1 Tax=Pomacea canaliculata TaxID=400727 RepID=UPI000D72FF9E|nr:melatonin receptor type 1B-B-like [Pomacea canaliculata]